MIPRHDLDKGFDLLNPELKIFKPLKSDLETFILALKSYIKNLALLENDQEKPTEQYLTHFLKSAFSDYQNKYEIRSTDDIDLCICLKGNKRPLVLIEFKKPSETKDFPNNENLNVKALHQLVYYYLKETIEYNNTAIKSLIITNGKELFIFDEAQFNRCFGKKHNQALKEEYQNKKDGKRSTQDFYDAVKRYLTNHPEVLESKLSYLYFSLEALKPELEKMSPLTSWKLQKTYKALCKYSLLKEALPNTGNTLNQAFYDELLHIIGLEEVKEAGKKLIQRKKQVHQPASLIESILSQNKEQFSTHTTPKNREDKAIELAITWVNRILFLKLLEAQLVRYHEGNQQFKFMDAKAYLTDWDHVNQLFFEVLAVKETERSQTDAKIKALHFVPYLNSSLFEKSALEKQLGTINNLTENELPLHPKTVLKHQGERRKGALRNIDYLLSFLDAYDFGSDAQDEGVQHTDKTLINASVLGLVFEKINGYKEGSFYTPSVITMYMCKESLRLMVLQKLNEAFEWQHTQWEELKTACQNFGVNERNTANAVINSLKICDPAVGSGHFLVSALNELLAIKADLELLCKDGKPYRLDITIVNDELVIQDDTTTGLFQYQVALDKDENRTVAKRTQAVQELLFDEKRTLIEKTLFGVDINPNSVQICRLRLWIELLKHTYYKPETAFKELETLPNIDINIKCGNSLISQFGLTEKIDGRTSKGKAIAELQELVADYHRESNKEKKHALDERMKEIKATVVESIRESSPERANLSKLRISLQALEHEEIILRGKLEDPDYIAVFESKVKSMKQELVQIRRTITSTRKKLQKAEAFIQEAKQNPIYKHAFEWRFEFPDVLNPTTGDFEGFDVVIGNPPYMRVQELQKYALDLKRNYEANYKTAVGGYELANLFYERGIELLKATGVKTYIMPHKFLNSENGTGLRDYLLQKKTLTTLLHFGANMVFDSADTYTAITLSKKQADVSDGFLFYKTPFNRNFMQELKSFDFPFSLNTYQNIQTNTKCYNADAWILFNTPKEHAIFQKIYQYPQTIVGKIFEEVFVGLQTSFDNLYILHDCIQNKGTLTGVRESYKQVFPEKSYTVETEFFKPFLMGKNVHRYETLQTTQYVFFPYQLIEGKAIPVTLEVLKHSYPLTYAYVMENEVHFKARESGKAAKLEHWFGYIYPKNLVKFEQPKLSSMEICTNEPNVTLNDSNLYHTTKVYSWVKKKTCLLSDYYLLAFLNSNLFWWFLMNTGDTLQSDSRTIKTNYVNPFPIPTNASPQSSEKLAGLVKQVMLCKQENYKADTKDLEAEIDVLVYQLYNLTYAEVLVVQPSFALPQATYEAGLTSMQALAMASPTAPPTTATVDVTTPTQPQLNFE